jgi:hypothetical protein
MRVPAFCVKCELKKTPGLSYVFSTAYPVCCGNFSHAHSRGPNAMSPPLLGDVRYKCPSRASLLLLLLVTHLTRVRRTKTLVRATDEVLLPSRPDRDVEEPATISMSSRLCRNVDY